MTKAASTGVSTSEISAHCFVRIEEMKLEALGLELSRVRCPPPARVQTLQRDLATHGQLTPLVARMVTQGPPQLLDGFKRLRAARELGWQRLKVGCLEATAATALCLMLTLNRRFGLSHIEEALVVQELVRSGLTGVEVGVLLGRHKSWVSRRLGLLQSLAPELVEDLKLGLLEPGMARQLLVLPRGNQVELAAVAREAALGVRQTEKLVRLWRQASSEQAQKYVITHPQEAIAQTQTTSSKHPEDPRLSRHGQWVHKCLRATTAAMAALTQALSHDLCREDQSLLQQDFRHLQQQMSHLSFPRGPGGDDGS